MHTIATCRSSVARAYYGMLECGVSPFCALDAAARVYKYHHPGDSIHVARSRVEEWLNVRILQ
jgi:hypothetical protein